MPKSNITTANNLVYIDHLSNSGVNTSLPQLEAVWDLVESKNFDQASKDLSRAVQSVLRTWALSQPRSGRMINFDRLDTIIYMMTKQYCSIVCVGVDIFDLELDTRGTSHIRSVEQLQEIINGISTDRSVCMSYADMCSFVLKSGTSGAVSDHLNDLLYVYDHEIMNYIRRKLCVDDQHGPDLTKICETVARTYDPSQLLDAATVEDIKKSAGIAYEKGDTFQDVFKHVDDLSVWVAAKIWHDEIVRLNAVDKDTTNS